MEISLLIIDEITVENIPNDVILKKYKDEFLIEISQINNDMKIKLDTFKKVCFDKGNFETIKNLKNEILQDFFSKYQELEYANKCFKKIDELMQEIDLRKYKLKNFDVLYKYKLFENEYKDFLHLINLEFQLYEINLKHEELNQKIESNMKLEEKLRERLTIMDGNIRRMDVASEQIDRELKNIYTQILTILGVFVSIFTLISVNVDLFKNSLHIVNSSIVTTTQKNISGSSIVTVSTKYSVSPWIVDILSYLAINIMVVLALWTLILLIRKLILNHFFQNTTKK